MKLKEPKNANYCATVVEIKNKIIFDNCDNVCGTTIMGNQVVINNDAKIGDVGLFFPVETQLSKEYLSSNNLYRKSELNLDKNEKGYFEENGRIRCQKFRGHDSEGLFMPINSIEFTFNENASPMPVLGNEFDELNGIPICNKYIVPKRTQGLPNSKKGKSPKKFESKLIDNQFRFHQDTSMLYKNLHEIKPDSIIHISYKIHGTSGISSYILCKKPLRWYEKLAKKVGLNIVTTEYDYIYSSRKVIKNEELNPNAQHFYSEDIWGIAHKELEPYIQKGMTLYYEIAGYLPNGGMIQGGYDYGHEPGKHGIYIYRITHTNPDGKVFEFSARQVQEWCKLNGLNSVPELWYGKAGDFDSTFELVLAMDEKQRFIAKPTEVVFNSDSFLSEIKNKYNEKDCFMCKNKVPEEGCVIRIDSLDLKTYKQKSTRFLERETKENDKGIENIEDNN